MKFLLASDLHLEFHQDNGKELIASFPEADGIILAGDITTRFTMKSVMERFCKKYDHVIYITGNHEYYGSNPTTVHKTINQIRKEQFHYLDCSHVEIGDQRILGATLWFPEHPGIPPMVNDFSAIEGFVPWVYDECQRAKEYLNNNIQEGDIVVTHHLPAKGSISRSYKGCMSNAFFLCDIEEIIQEKKPRLICHGHTHDSCDYMIDNTRILCNPYGYPGLLNSKFKYLEVEV